MEICGLLTSYPSCVQISPVILKKKIKQNSAFCCPAFFFDVYRDGERFSLLSVEANFLKGPMIRAVCPMTQQISFVVKQMRCEILSCYMVDME